MSTETNAHDLALAAVDEAFGEYVKNLFRTVAGAANYASMADVPLSLRTGADARPYLRQAITEGLK
jgi:hypothetical protein